MTKIEKMPPDTWLADLENWQKEAEIILSLLKKENHRQMNTLENGQMNTSKNRQTISVSISHGKPQFFTRIKTNGKLQKKYFHKEQETNALQILQLDLLQQTITGFEQNLKLINTFIKQYKKHRIWNYFETLPQPKQKVLTPIFLPLQTYAEKWQKETYPANTFFPDTLEHYTAKAERVRSKSEVIIADTLNSMGIPYKYEKPLKLGNITVHPDFTCLNPRTRQEILWEHFGMMDDPKYTTDFCRKLQTYQTYGYFLGQQLIISCETTSNPFTKLQAKQIIEKYLR